MLFLLQSQHGDAQEGTYGEVKTPASLLKREPLHLQFAGARVEPLEVDQRQAHRQRRGNDLHRSSLDGRKRRTQGLVSVDNLLHGPTQCRKPERTGQPQCKKWLVVKMVVGHIFVEKPEALLLIRERDGKGGRSSG